MTYWQKGTGLIEQALRQKAQCGGEYARHIPWLYHRVIGTPDGKRICANGQGTLITNTPFVIRVLGPELLEIDAMLAGLVRVFAPHALARGVSLQHISTPFKPASVLCEPALPRRLLSLALGHMIKNTNHAQLLIALRSCELSTTGGAHVFRLEERGARRETLTGHPGVSRVDSLERMINQPCKIWVEQGPDQPFSLELTLTLPSPHAAFAASGRENTSLSSCDRSAL